MKRASTVLVIDDNVKRHKALLKDLAIDYKKAVPLESPDEAIIYIEQHLDDRMIVVLDYKFGHNEPTGKYVLEKIREKSHLIPVILWSAEDISQEDYPEFINKGTFAVVISKEAHEDLLSKVKEADIKLSNSVEGAIEEWLEIHSESERASTFLVTSDGAKYSLNDILSHIRLQTEIGQQFEKKLLKLTIDRLMRNKEKLNG